MITLFPALPFLPSLPFLPFLPSMPFLPSFPSLPFLLSLSSLPSFSSLHRPQVFWHRLCIFFWYAFPPIPKHPFLLLLHHMGEFLSKHFFDLSEKYNCYNKIAIWTVEKKRDKQSLKKFEMYFNSVKFLYMKDDMLYLMKIIHKLSKFII